MPSPVSGLDLPLVRSAYRTVREGTFSCQLRGLSKSLNLSDLVGSMLEYSEIIKSKDPCLSQIIAILGMHRSGTSCLAGSLQQAGLFLGDVFTQNPYNKKGNRESRAIMTLHDEILSSNGGSWFAPAENNIWSKEHLSVLDTIIAGYTGSSYWGFKDPRTLFLLDAWQEKLPQLRFVGTVRNPKSVARSLLARNSELGDMTFFMELWNRYNLRLLAEWERNPFPVINFDRDDSEYEQSLKRLMALIGLPESSLSLLGRGEFARVGRRMISSKEMRFFDPSLRSGICSEIDGLPSHIAGTYQRLREIAI